MNKISSTSPLSEQADLSSVGSRASNPFVGFAIRVIIVVFVTTFALSWLIDNYKLDTASLKASFQRTLNKNLARRDTRLRLNGFAAGNPRVNWELSIMSEVNGDMDRAYDEMLVAVGVLEKSNVRAEIISPYLARLEQLKASMEKLKVNKAN